MQFRNFDDLVKYLFQIVSDNFDSNHHIHGISNCLPPKTGKSQPIDSFIQDLRPKVSGVSENTNALGVHDDFRDHAR